MGVSAGKTVRFEYTLTHDGKEIDGNVGREPLEYTHGEHQIIPGLEQQLEGMEVGDSKTVTVQPEDAYGMVDPEAFVEFPKDKVPDEAHKVGVTMSARDPEGNVLHPVVAEVKDSTVVLNFNHPLAGKTLVFEVKIVGVDDIEFDA